MTLLQTCMHNAITSKQYIKNVVHTDWWHQKSLQNDPKIMWFGWDLNILQNCFAFSLPKSWDDEGIWTVGYLFPHMGEIVSTPIFAYFYCHYCFKKSRENVGGGFWPLGIWFWHQIHTLVWWVSLYWSVFGIDTWIYVFESTIQWLFDDVGLACLCQHFPGSSGH